MTLSEDLASFVIGSSFEDLSPDAVGQLKIRVLDSIGCAVGALEGEPMAALREQLADFGGRGKCSLIGGGRTAPDRAAFYNGALVRYLDFNDSYLAPKETCHPSDNLGAVLAASEYAGKSGKHLLTALAVSYQVQCRLSDVAPVRAKGFDHTVQGLYGSASGVSKALDLDREATAHAVAISGTAFNALRVSRTGRLSHWKGLAAPNAASASTWASFLAMRGITGPREVFEGNKGFMESIAGRFDIDWSREDLEMVNQTILKRYNAEIHSQSVIEGVLDLKAESGFGAEDVERLEIDIFDVAYNIIGGGEEGDKTVVSAKEEADHSLHYIVAAAVCDGRVMPEQYRPERIRGRDVQELLQRIRVRENDSFSRRFPQQMPCAIRVLLRDGRTLELEKTDYEGFFTNPMSLEKAEDKFKQLALPYADSSLRREIVQVVMDLEHARVEDLVRPLAAVGGGRFAV